MKVKINDKTFVLGGGLAVLDALSAAKINPETVLVKRNNKLIPHDAALKEGDQLETVTVISGG